MSDRGLVADDLRKRFRTEVHEASTFETIGVTRAEAVRYLDSPEGELYFQRVVDADPASDALALKDRAIEQIQTGRELPRMEIIDEPIVKIVPAGHPDRSLSYSPFFAKRSAFEDAVARGYNLSDYFGLPIKSEGQVYNIYEIRPNGPTEIFVNTVAPTSELNGQVTKRGGAEQYLVPNRRLYSDAVIVAQIGNDLYLHKALVAGRGLAPPIVALTESALERKPRMGLSAGQRGMATVEALIGEVPQHTLMRAAGPLATGVDLTLSLRRSAELDAQDNPQAAKAELERFAARNVGGWAGGTVAYIAGAPAAVVASTAVAASVALEKVVEWRDYEEITNQKLQNADWEFEGRSWNREARLDKPRDGLDQPVQDRVSASYEQTRVLNHKANMVAAGLALADAPAGQNPFDLPANSNDRTGANNPNWQRNAQTEQWERQVNVGTAKDPIPQLQTASPQRAAELNQQAVARVLQNVATGREAIAALYQEQHLSHRAHEVGELSPAVLAALPKPDTVTSFNGQTYQRSAGGAWSNGIEVAQGNLAAELELTRRVRQPFLEPHQERVAELQARPPLTPERKELDALVHLYRLAAIELEPDFPEAIALATQRTREANGLSGPALLQLQPQLAQAQYDAAGQLVRGSTVPALRPIDHYKQGADGAYRVVAETSSEDIMAALAEVRSARQSGQERIPTLAAVAAVSPPGMKRIERNEEGDDRQALASERTPLLADNSSHSDFDTFDRIHQWVRGTGRWNDDESRNVASALYREQASDPMIQRVDRVVGALGKDGAENVFAVYAPHGDMGPFLRVHVDGREAVQQPAQPNLEQADQIRQEQVRQQQMELQQQKEQQQQRVPLSSP